MSTADGLRPIETIQAGDEVWAFDLRTGNWVLRPVRETFSREYDGNAVVVRVAGSTVETTPGHPFWVIAGEDLSRRPLPEHPEPPPPDAAVAGRWVDSHELRAGDTLLLKEAGPAVLESVELKPVRYEVYNFAVVELQCYAVGPQQILIHNMCEALADDVSNVPNTKRYPDGSIRTPDGKFAGTTGTTPGSPGVLQAKMEINSRPGWRVAGSEISVRDAKGTLRRYDLVAQDPHGKFVGIEVKSGTATRTRAQRRIDANLNTNGGLDTIGKRAFDAGIERISSVEMIHIP